VSESSLKNLESHLGLVGLAERLGAALSRAADPGLAPKLAADVLKAAGSVQPERLREVWKERPNELARVLTTLCGAAPFLVSYLVKYPAWVFLLLDDELGTERAPVTYDARLAAVIAGTPADEKADALRRFKYYELARITIRELSPGLVPPNRAGETLAELSHLADALLARALTIAAERLAESCGPPRWQGPSGETIDLGFCVLGLGKLGSEELNYSSDVDLIYIFQAAPGGALGSGPRDLSPVEYFTRLAQELGRLVTEATGEGFLYRIDLDLRPEGSQGALVVSSEALVSYYELWAATWEKAAFMKARPVAGDTALGWRTIRATDPMIYRSAIDYAGVDAIKAMKEKIEQSRFKAFPGAGRAAARFDVKVGSGGIRDVEFVAQALQLLHGGQIPDVRSRSTQQALIALGQVGVLPARQTLDLLAAYYFLRRTENRLQMEAERQTHRLPAEPAGLERLARAMGFQEGDGVAAFEQALEAHRQRIREIFAALFHDSGSDRILALFARNVPQLLTNPAARRLIEGLAEHFAREIEASPDPERGMNNLDRFIRGVGGRRFYYELLIDRPELVPRLAALFAASEYFSTYFATHPRLIEPIFSDPNVLLLSRQELAEDLAKIRNDLAREGARDETELELDALRLFHNRALINVGLLDLGQRITPSEAERALTDIAEVCVEAGLTFARAEMDRRTEEFSEAVRKGDFLVVGMGKLASREITYGSDLDVIFLYDAADADLVQAQEYFVRLAQKLIGALRTRTPEGVCYEIDARLRPSGRQGTLVTSLASLRRYHATSAQVWERQAMLRARPVAGAVSLGQAFESLRLQILRRRLPSHLGQEIHRIRLRMESELGRETQRRHDFKTGRGGLLDVESVVQFLQLRHGAAHEELFTVDGVAGHLRRLGRLRLLDEQDARTLREGWQFLQLLSSRLRIVQNRSISDLDEERGDLDALARQLGYPPSQRTGGPRRALLDDYRRHTTAIRAVYLKVLIVE
jgi:[glutamine synthetase] adenylyltransferase / [glutamine synthetase]-adenylyl-L-tyrosine phosphorylase